MRLLAAVLLALLTLTADSRIGEACADDGRGFWQPGVVVNYESTPKENSSQDFVFQNHPRGMPTLVPDAQEVSVATNQQGPEQQQQQQVVKPENEQQQMSAPLPAQAPLSKEDVYKKYGPPTQDLPIRAIKDAPPALQGIFDCLAIGDEQCAFEYSQQMARYDKRVQDTVAKVTEMRMVGHEAEGFRAAPNNGVGTGPMSPERLKALKYLEQAKKLRAAKAVNIEGALADQGNPVEADASEAALAAGAPPVAIPIDPAGRVKVLIFFDEASNSLHDFVEKIRPLKSMLKGSSSLEIVGLTSHSYSRSGLKKVGAETSFPFPLLSGEALSKEVLISTYPTLLFVAVTSKETYRLEGPRTSEEIEKVIRLMQGGR